MEDKILNFDSCAFRRNDLRAIYIQTTNNHDYEVIAHISLGSFEKEILLDAFYNERAAEDFLQVIAREWLKEEEVSDANKTSGDTE
jgi:hypothetical protein